MTFQKLAEKIGVSLLDLIPDEEEVSYLKNEELYECGFTDDLCNDGLLKYRHGKFSVVEGI